MPIISSWKVQYGDVVIEPNTIIDILSPEEEQELVDGGYAEFTDIDVEASLDEELISIEEFAKLRAGEQSELLQKAEIEPGTNSEARIQQYTDWLAQQQQHDPS